MYVKHFLQIYMAYFSPLVFLNKRNKATFRLQLKVAEVRVLCCSYVTHKNSANLTESDLFDRV